MQALEFREGDKNCLVARSQCYLQLGDAEKALKDAEETLVDDKNYIKVRTKWKNQGRWEKVKKKFNVNVTCEIY